MTNASPQSCEDPGQVDYLGYVISVNGVATNPQKKVYRGYETISKPLSSLLKKDAFGWNPEAELGFNQLKEMMIKAPVLALPDFSQPFVVEIDACGKGIGVILMQGGRPIVYLSKALAPKNIGLYTYEKEFLALLLAVTKWKHYLQVIQANVTVAQSYPGYRNVRYVKGPSMTTALTQGYCNPCLFLTRLGHVSSWISLRVYLIMKARILSLVVVNRLTKYFHFLALKHPYTATSVAKIFFDNIYKLHGLPSHQTEVEGLMQERIKVLQLLKDNLHLGQQRMKLYANKRRPKREFEVGDEVFLKLQPYRQTTMALIRKQLKLFAKYFGPYKVLEKVGKVAYKLALPPRAKIHLLFHVSLLKKIGSKYFPSLDLPEFEDEVFKTKQPGKITVLWLRGFLGSILGDKAQKKEKGMSHFITKMRFLVAAMRWRL
ncbi:UNVERIFIED_CONTAM: Retrovirus-related Pol polyprotein from transposon [Sesamum radiatum]|uniref:Retrovirus-related Pol polyprotein from transposon n=1 Tax=Sesamum radiatum TaxID=300843 RepID=A0AAW2U9Q7_SESRA